MKTWLSIISISLISLSCDQSFETKLIDESYSEQESNDKQNKTETSKLEINAITLIDSWLLEPDSKRRVSTISPFQNIIINDSINSYYITSFNTNQVLILKKDVHINLSSKVTLNDFEIFSKPDLTKRTNEVYAPGSILIIAPMDLNDFYEVRKYDEKKWFFIRKQESQLSNNTTDLKIAYNIDQIKKGAEESFIKTKMFEELTQSEDFNRPEWLPAEKEEIDSNEEDDML